MDSWESLLNVTWPRGAQSACDQSGECCRGAAQVAPWERLLKNAGQGEETARDFLNQYVPYPDRLTAENTAPHAVEASLKIALERGEKMQEVVFYHCRFLKDRNECQIYEDRPDLCRDYPESPFGAIPRCCGYFDLAQTCHDRIRDLKNQLAHLKKLQSDLDSQHQP